MQYIVAIAWIYVTLLMSATETSVVAGVMTFTMYCVFPLTIVLYLMRSGKRKREKRQIQVAMQQKPHQNAVQSLKTTAQDGEK